MDNPSPQQPELNRGHHFEYLDRLHIALSYIEMSLGDHPMLERYPSLQTRYDRVVDDLATMYQEVGQLRATWE